LPPTDVPDACGNPVRSVHPDGVVTVIVFDDDHAKQRRTSPVLRVGRAGVNVVLVTLLALAVTAPMA
jgi:hypothetical protein